MPNTFQGTSAGADGRFAIVVSRFNESITARLLEAAVETLVARGVPEQNIDVAWVPGAFEIPTVAARLAAAGRYAAILCLGAVIRGQTSHDQHINRAVSMALAQLGMQHQLPVLFGVLTCDTLEQAVARSGGQAATGGKDYAGARPGNKGVDCAEAALEMVNLLAKLPRAGEQKLEVRS
ncbi:MAG: 6,7-dimethyl-8-ribityllumazine synthase [Thermoguttaceae bacterium]|jgi:6,7-dimethyl-8-ribityllumazine synthase